MAGPLLCVLGLLWAQGTLSESLGSPLRVAQCRAKCIHTFPGEEGGGRQCLQSTNCHNCWEQCQRLGAGWSAVCEQPTVCQAGCLQACRFHLQLEVQRSPVLVTRGEEVIMLSEESASWPPPASPGTPHVFVLMCRQPDNTWIQVVQTLELSWHNPGPLGCKTVRVMVVSVDGLVTVYSPAPSPLQDADLIMRSVGRDLSDPQVRLPADEVRRYPSFKDIHQVAGWNLREVSLIHQEVLVIAEVSWDPQFSTPPVVYLVTWELAEGGIKGNLLTDSTCVTLSLWPDTIYRIQVQLVRDPRRLSEILVLDTRQAAIVPVSSQHPASQPVQGHPGFEGVAGAATAVFVFIAIALIVSSKRRATSPEKKSKDVDELYTSNYFKLFPPPVTLLLEPPAAPECLAAATGTPDLVV